jgi:hypothetical protein
MTRRAKEKDSLVKYQRNLLMILTQIGTGMKFLLYGNQLNYMPNVGK